jgi:hypothetical protein
MRLLAALAVLASLLLASTASAQVPKEDEVRASGAKRLTTDEIRALHADRTVYHHNVANGLRMPMWYSADGTRSFRAGNRTFTGEWGAREDKRCDETIAGPVVCLTFYQRGDEWIVCDPREAPDCRWRITRSVEGDVEKLAKKP